MRMLTAASVALLALPSISLAGEEVVMIDGTQRQIPTTITLPDGDGPFPFVVMFHGTGSDRHEAGGGYDLLAPKLAEAGIASARFDFAGNGDSPVDYVEYTPSSGLQDGQDVIAYMQGLDQVADDRLGLLGWSQGGMIAMMAAIHTPDEVKSLVTWAGVVDMSDYMADKYDEAKANGFTVMEFDWREPLNLSVDWFDEVRALDLATDLAGYDGAVLAIAGSNDDVVLPEVTDTILQAAGSDDEAKEIIEGADHTFNIFSGDMTAFDELMQLTVDRFATTL
ncbi:alpha/beta fold hydrolase [Devosia sp. YIM 151766]|uniref:alpha/beta hydrolase family protein n=1 Tax=Devosia sp. YIM 151766 TaxID=3017325 RepID=UPI00255CCB32|nr:alpha/beta fold hydrolase [Devosia sp. YIM 151766]WIY52249.1 alpha/beta fold hydrolase [Devosia sp. YIM 151766]